MTGFLIVDENVTCTFFEMCEANDEDEDFLAWLGRAQVGDEWAGHAGVVSVRCVDVAEDFRPQEIAFRKPGGTWKRRTVKTAGVFAKLIDRLNDEGAEVQVRDAE